MAIIERKYGRCVIYGFCVTKCQSQGYVTMRTIAIMPKAYFGSQSRLCSVHRFEAQISEIFDLACISSRKKFEFTGVHPIKIGPEIVFDKRCYRKQIFVREVESVIC